MKIIHAADLHLGSKIEAKLKRISDERKMEVRNSFMRLADYAEKEDIHIILLSGDVFDSDRPFKKDKDTFYSVIKQHPNIDFLYLRGNHDTEESYVEDIPNLKMFSNAWVTYTYENVAISGIEISKENYSSFYSTLNLDPNMINIVMLHGQISDSIGVDKIKLSKLRDKNIDYLALGHIHSYSSGELDNRGRYAYSGCLEGRGFDEYGDKGFIVFDSENKEKQTFIPFAKRTIRVEEVDVSSLTSIPEIVKKIKDTVHFHDHKEDIYRINLVGDVPAETEFSEKDIESNFPDVYFINVKNLTKPLIDPEEYKNDLSLKGEFVRTVYSKEDLTDDEKRKIVSLGLKALEGREVK